jgi:hypothetical protein
VGKAVELFIADSERCCGHIGNPASGFRDYGSETEL